MYQLRFNLGRGINYLKWKVVYPNGDIKYFCPEEFNIKATNAKLVNRKKTAIKIFEGAYKSVCAWIEAENLEVVPSFKSDTIHLLHYNPKVAPSWTYNSQDIDGFIFSSICTQGRRVYTNNAPVISPTLF